MKIGFVILVHYSEKFRNNGLLLADKCISSLYSELDNTQNFYIYIVDNGSEIQYDYKKWNNKILYHYIKDQSEKGITGGWNIGIDMAFNDNCDIICMTSDDIIFNTTINPFLNFIKTHNESNNSIYFPLSEGLLSGIQKQSKPNYKIYKFPDNEIPSGFFFAFTRNFYEKYRFADNEMFPLKHEYDGGDGIWGGQEGYFITLHKQGVIFYLNGFCWLYHGKEMGYRKVRDYYKGKIE